jgi:epoxyqueuosine reductase
VADVDLSSAEPGLQAWLAAGFAGSMSYLHRHGLRRARPAELVPGTVRVVTVRMDYLPRQAADDWIEGEWAGLADVGRAQVSVYARGRDYHKVLRRRLQQLADRLAEAVGPLGHRVFVDSAPVLEVELAARSGLGWRGKHTLALSREGGSMFFLGELFVDLPLPVTAAVPAHCGECRACLAACPTGAIVAPYRLDARRCLSYLTIEHDGPIPLEFRAALGNRVYGCDDCQLACPWNKYARRSSLADFDARDAVTDRTLLDLWRSTARTAEDFQRATEGSAIRRIGVQRWQRNLAVAIGNALRAGASGAAAVPIDALREALQSHRPDASPLVREHLDWALAPPDGRAAAG